MKPRIKYNQDTGEFKSRLGMLYVSSESLEDAILTTFDHHRIRIRPLTEIFSDFRLKGRETK